MFKFLSFRKTESVTSSINKKLDRIIELLEQEQRLRSEIDGKNIHFDQVHINHLENIIFRLDKIEVDELSGKLIIGNNINATEDLEIPNIKKANSEMDKKEVMAEESPSIQVNFSKTPRGYRFRNES